MSLGASSKAMRSRARREEGGRALIGRLSCLLLTIVLSNAARAELPPYVYEAERQAARDVVVISDVQVQPYAGKNPSGACTIKGRVAAVERGASFRPGEAIALKITCITPAYQSRPGPFPGYPQAWLADLRSARVFVKDGMVIRRGLESLDVPASKSK
jgi:hypothetical protein